LRALLLRVGLNSQIKNMWLLYYPLSQSNQTL
jgi:hypothetical protein